MKRRSYSTPRAKCPVCSYQTDRAGATEDDGAPRPGDLTVCLNCGELMEFDERLEFRQLGEEEKAKAMQHGDAARIVETIKARGPIRRMERTEEPRKDT